ncbi:MAG: hypothetical protein PF542_00130 [Nanoarchaeota archaeon]|jgi:hypothetical protein|nr:hypothetical protein [Nanoarchaeota archaeon]
MKEEISEKEPINYSKQGTANKRRGLLFETKVREDLESKGWIVTKWMNTVDFDRDKVAPARRKYNPFTKALSIGTGFPDLLCFKKNGERYDVIGVEVKSTGLLDQMEKGQCLWYLTKKVFPRILIARKKKEGARVNIEYEDFKEKYLDKGKLDVKDFNENKVTAKKKAVKKKISKKKEQ